MSNGIYGTNISAKIDANDVDIYYAYYESRNSDSAEKSIFKKISSNILVQSIREQDSGSVDNVLEGMYNLKLPLNYFNKKGFYTVYIKPKEIPVTLLDVGVLAAYPDVKGLVVDTNSINDSNLKVKFQSNNDLVGYRIEYLDDSGKRQDFYRLVTSNNKCEPVVQNLSDSNQKSVRYRYNESSTLTFITVTPSTAPTFKPNAIPFIGKVTQRVLFINTKFSPIMLDIEMTDHDIDTVSNMLEGSQLRDLDNGLVTTFNNNNEVYSQSEFYTLKNDYDGQPVFEVKKNRGNNIDFSQNINDK